MPTLTVTVTEAQKRHLGQFCDRFGAVPENLLVRMAERLVEVDDLLRQSGLTGLGPSALPDREPGETLIEIELDAGVHGRYLDLCRILRSTGEVVMALMAARLVRIDQRYLSHGSAGVAAFFSPNDTAQALGLAAEEGVCAVTGDIRPGDGLVWPADKPFPLSDAECAAVMRGHKVRWRGTREEYHELLPGRYEIHDGFLVTRSG